MIDFELALGNALTAQVSQHIAVGLPVSLLSGRHEIRVLQTRLEDPVLPKSSLQAYCSVLLSAAVPASG